jgi:AraC-like DNA-binding protein
MAIPAVVAEFGGDLQEMCRLVGLAPSVFSAPDNPIPFVAGSRLIELCVQETGCEAFGFLVGQRVTPSALGLPGFMLRAAPDVRTALELLIKHLSLHDEGGTVSLNSNGLTTALAYTLIRPNNPVADQIYDLSIAAACNIMRALCGPRWTPIAVRLTRQRCPDWPAYKKFFSAHLELGTAAPSILFATTWLDRAVPTADPLLLLHLEQQAQARHEVITTHTTDRVSRLLCEVFAQSSYSEAECARHLGVHVRTLRRRLKAEGTSFSRELEKFRHERACEMLTRTRMPAAEIAGALGFADTTAFSRAFKSWSGVTATEWRRAHGK